MPHDLATDAATALADGALDPVELADEMGPSPDLDDSALEGSRISPSRARRPEIARTLKERFGFPARDLFNDAVERPNSLKDLVQVVADGLKDKKRLRMVGASRGHSAASHPTNARIVSSERLSRIFSGVGTDIDGLSLRPGATQVVRVQAGVPVREALRALADQGLAIPNHGSGDFQSVVGAISTGTHGSGSRFRSVAGFVRSLVVVRVKQTPKGPVPWVELVQRSEAATTQAPVFAAPSGGKWRARTGNVDIHPVFDDDRFFAHLVGMGSLGLVYSMTLKVVPMLRLQEWREPKLLTDVLAELPQLNTDNRHVELVIDPYPREPSSDPIAKRKEVLKSDTFDFGALRCQVVRRKETTAAKGGHRPPTMEYGRLPFAAGAIGSQIRGVLKDPVDKGPKAGQALISCTSMTKGDYIDDLPEVLLLNLKYAGLGAEWAVPLPKLEAALKLILGEGCWKPYVARRKAGTPSLDAQVASLEKSAPFFQGPSVRFVRGEGALLAGSHEKGPGNTDVPVWAHIEIGFLGSPELEDAWRPRKRHLGLRPEETVVDQVVPALVQKLKKKDAQKPNAPDLVPPQNLPAIQHPKKRDLMRLYAAYERGREASLVELEKGILALGGRPHQGLWHALEWSDVKAAWGSAADRWRACFLATNPVGTFDGALTDQWRIRTTP
ncbi:MAG: FAD-binding oxidoreductase [Myxococcota bacterium]